MLDSKFQPNADYTVQTFLDLVGQNTDVGSKKLWLSPTKYICIIYLQGLVDGEKLDNLTQHVVETKAKSETQTLDDIDSFISVIKDKEVYTYKQAISCFFKGQPLLFISESTTAYSLNMSMTKQRSLSEPTTEK